MTLLRWRWHGAQHHQRVLFDHMSRYVTRNLKNRSHAILRLWTEHCEYIVAQQCRRAQQMACLYGRLWDERALRELMRRVRKQVQRHSKGFVFGTAVAIQQHPPTDSRLQFDWDAERIPYESIRPHLDEIEFVRALQRATIECGLCGKRSVIDARVDGVEYCACTRESKQDAKAARPEAAAPQLKNLTATAVSEEKRFSEWQPYLERENMVVWRREERPGLYAYKVHASYTDITAEDFLYVQTDTEYRKVWDKTAIALDIVDVDPSNRAKSQVVYWEMLWPKLFANRDYVYRRRIIVDRQRRTIVIASQSIRHPCCPPMPSKQRVQDYWSYMVIRPTVGSFRRPGLEYVLTYFDNPGVVVPPAVTSWVAQKQMPDFLNKLHQATLVYARDRKSRAPAPVDDDDDSGGSPEEAPAYSRRWLVANMPQDPGFEYPADVVLRYGICEDSSATKRRANDDEDEDYDSDDDDRGGRRGSGGTSGNGNEVDLLEDTDTANAVPRKSSWWNYLWPYSYFASS